MRTVIQYSGLTWFLLLVTGICAIYLPGLQNELVFDDVRMIVDGQIWSGYGGLAEFKQRMLSYGSFVWFEQLFGEGWWKQRVFNLVLHGLTVLSIYWLFSMLICRLVYPDAIFGSNLQADASNLLTLKVGVLLFAFNPVAVYAVAYLVQRSIIMACLFMVLSLGAFSKGLLSRRVGWFALSLLLYSVAVLSKEHAIMAPAVALGIYVYLERPSWRQLLWVLLACLALAGGVAALFFQIYGTFIGAVFDELSRSYIAELSAIEPDIMNKAWPLSVLNQAALFFFYGFLWVVPIVSWMSIDLRPPFPMSVLSWPHWLGALMFVGGGVGAVWGLFRGRPHARLFALCILVPMVLFVTEFFTVWIQDPFVLYRSYLWAITLPGLFVILMTGVRPKVVVGIGLLLIVLFGVLSFERVVSLKSKLSVWQDAAEKTELFDSPSAVGRWRPYLNKGAYFLENNLPDAAAREFARAIELGERRGHAYYNLGTALQLQGRLDEAVTAFEIAEERGTKTIPALYVNRGEARFALGRLKGAVEDFETVLTMDVEGSVRRLVFDKLVKLSLAMGEYGEARVYSEQLLGLEPESYEARLNFALSLAALGENDEALNEIDALLQRQLHPSAFYGQAIAYHQSGRHVEALRAIDRALQLQPNPTFLAFRDRVRLAIDELSE